MLTLTRRLGDSIYLEVAGVVIRVEVALIDRNKVRLAVDAPGEVFVHRGDNRPQALVVFNSRGTTPA